jgi:hypothetical protein
MLRCSSSLSIGLTSSSSAIQRQAALSTLVRRNGFSSKFSFCEKTDGMTQLTLERLSVNTLWMYTFLALGSFLSLFPSQTIYALKSFFPVFKLINSRAVGVIWLSRLYGLILTTISVLIMAKVYSVHRIW